MKGDSTLTMTERMKEPLMKEPMTSFCGMCGHQIESDKDSIEIGLGHWKSKLEPYKYLRIICWDCFTKHLLDLLNLRNEWDIREKNK